MSIKYMTRVFDLPVPPVQKIVLLVLAYAADDNGISWVGLQLISQKASVSVRTVLRALSQSETDGVLARRPRYRKDRSRTSSEYQLFPQDFGSDKLSGGEGGEDRGEVPEESAPPDKGVVQTTTDPSINNINHHHNGLVFPASFSSVMKGAARQLLIGLPEEVAQLLVDEVAGRLATGGIRSSPVSYLRSLIARQIEGTFVPELAHHVAERRQPVVVKKSERQAAAKLASPEVAENHLSALRKKFGRGR
jgi:hypothetical protein